MAAARNPYLCNEPYLRLLIILNMAMGRNVEFVSDKSNVVRICTSGSYAPKWIS